MESETQRGLTGILYGSTAFFLWGLLPVYWKLLDHVPAFEVLNHRILWSAVFIALFLSGQSRWKELKRAVLDRRTAVLLCCSTVVIGVNWFIYIWAVHSGYVLETSLGYFINPILSVLLGVIFLQEKLSRWKKVSVFLAAAAVLYLTLDYGQFPWIGMGLALTFGFYGLLRKVIAVEALVGLGIETFALTAISLSYLVWLEFQGIGVFGNSGTSTLLLLIGAGPATFLPLLFFAMGARRLRLSTLGLLQYIAPTMQFFLAVFAFGETFTSTHLLAFCLIWTALAIFSVDAIAGRSRSPAGGPAA